MDRPLTNKELQRMHAAQDKAAAKYPKATWNKHGQPYPHVGGCEGCHEERKCNACGVDTRRDRGRCTNGRCTTCHVAICTPGGDTSPGHGFGSVEAAAMRAREAAFHA